MRRLALAACLALPLPALAQEDCTYLTSTFDICLGGTAWEAAEWEQGGDAATLHLGGRSFDYNDDYPGESTGPIEADLAGFNDFAEVDPAAIVATGTYGTDSRSALLQTWRDTEWDETVSLGLAEVEGLRILLMVRGPADDDPAALQDEVTTLVEAVSVRCPTGDCPPDE